ncbi:class I SAM-dependent methyltransferase, partial [Thermodesulfobacteriota bacterium]
CDAVTSGFLVRNVVDVRRAFEEQMRVVRPGGRVVCLDTSPVPCNMLRPFVLFHLNILIPFLGYLITRQRDAYKYLPRSTLNFMAGVGLKDVTFRRFMFGNIALHWGVRPEENGP